jgi:hypothetical protein
MPKGRGAMVGHHGWTGWVNKFVGVELIPAKNMLE